MSHSFVEREYNRFHVRPIRRRQRPHNGFGLDSGSFPVGSTKIDTKK